MTTPEATATAAAAGCADAPPTHLLYLHGFRSSPLSFKARRLAAWLAEHRPDVTWWCPQLPPSPMAALALVRKGIAVWAPGTTRAAVVGSSLGGYYATVIAEATGWPAVLLNPAVDPARDLAAAIGRHTAWHAPEQHLDFEPGYIQELQAMHPAELTRPGRYAAVIATGDEVLDWREMTARYRGARIRLVQGSDHGLSDFDDHLRFVLGFLNFVDPGRPMPD